MTFLVVSGAEIVIIHLQSSQARESRSNTTTGSTVDKSGLHVVVNLYFLASTVPNNNLQRKDLCGAY